MLIPPNSTAMNVIQLPSGSLASSDSSSGIHLTQLLSTLAILWAYPRSNPPIAGQESTRAKTLFSSVKHWLRALPWLSRRSQGARPSTETDPRRLDNGLSGRDVTVQLFQWSHEDVAKECEDHLGPAGYRYAQVSPVQESIQGPQWWVDYQPVSYTLGSKHGSETAFVDMVKRCEAVGVGIVADAVLNHMTQRNVGVVSHGTAGSPYTKYNYPGLYSRIDFHNCGRNGNNVLRNYSDRYEVQNCELVGLADLNTGSTQVQTRINQYLKSLIARGVQGFRLDAAKHMASGDISHFLSGVDVRVVQEVIFGRDEPIQPAEYMPNGRVHMFQAARDLRRMFLVIYSDMPLSNIYLPD